MGLRINYLFLSIINNKILNVQSNAAISLFYFKIHGYLIRKYMFLLALLESL
jgi:hypothetical protein